MQMAVPEMLREFACWSVSCWRDGAAINQRLYQSAQVNKSDLLTT
jgi:hypothetical protein